MAHFFCRVQGKGQPKNISGSTDSGLDIVAAGELGMVRLKLYATEEGDRFEISFEPWRGSRNSGGRGVVLAWGNLDFDKFVANPQGDEVVVRLGEEVLEAFNFCKAKEVMTKD